MNTIYHLEKNLLLTTNYMVKAIKLIFGLHHELRWSSDSEASVLSFPYRSCTNLPNLMGFDGQG